MKKKWLFALIPVAIILAVVVIFLIQRSKAVLLDDPEAVTSEEAATETEVPDEEFVESEVALDETVDENATDSDDSQEVAEEAPLDDEYAKAYAEALENICYENKLPNGDELEISGPVDDNEFAVADVDGDGIQELVILWSTASMAGMNETVYEYKPEDKSLKQEIMEFPGIEFYTDGLALVGWSHNQGYGEMWPYNIYKYDSANGVYEFMGYVDSWNKDISEQDYDGNAFPDDIDTDNAGVVYSIKYGDEYNGDYCSKSAYDEFYNKLIDSKSKLDLKYYNIQFNRIDKLRENKLNPVIKGKIVRPDEVNIDVDNLADGIYSVDIDPLSIYDFGDGTIEVSAVICAKETYDIVDMNTLEVGDGIECDGIVTEINSVQDVDGGVNINGPIEEGGLSFRAMDEDNCYVYWGFDDIATYHKFGTAYLKLAKDCVITDKSNLEEPDGVTVKSEEFISYVENYPVYMSRYNTTICVENGEIVELNIFYTP